MNEKFITEEWQRFFKLRQRVFDAIETNTLGRESSLPRLAERHDGDPTSNR